MQRRKVCIFSRQLVIVEIAVQCFDVRSCFVKFCILKEIKAKAIYKHPVVVVVAIVTCSENRHFLPSFLKPGVIICGPVSLLK